METNYNTNDCHKEYWFKSYYVVWKLFIIFVMAIVFFLFKSYYVVWKHSSPESRPNILSLFKSYYVVWKRLPQSHQIELQFRLNRTM